MRAKELAVLSVEELKAKVQELRKELMKLYSQVASGTAPKNPGQIKNSRKMIARIFTILRKKEVQK